MQWHMKSNRKASGGLLQKRSKKHKRQRGRDFLPAHIGNTKIKSKRTKGGNIKRIVMATDAVNVMHKGKAQKAKIISVAENKADSQFVRRNIMTKGAVIETDIGKARITSRPGQMGAVNAILIQEKTKEKDKPSKS